MILGYVRPFRKNPARFRASPCGRSLAFSWTPVYSPSTPSPEGRRPCGRVSDVMDIPRMGVPEQLAERMSLAEQHEYLRARFPRRALMRGGAVTLGAVAGGAFVPGAVAQAAVPTQRTAPATEAVDGAYVAPFGRHLAYGNDPRTEMAVSWQVPVA